ncbi:S-layer family protein, partial [Salmonella enterica subsp. enterica]|nr:S-layer family protein [Salmonella enterica subsp. enterica serovar Hvittingfoss]
KVSATKINEKLNEGTNVTIKTSGTHTPDEATTQGGNITVSADITKSSGADASLTLEADKNITVNKNITSSQGKLNVNLLGAGSSDGAVVVNTNANISANGGDVVVKRVDKGESGSHYLTIDLKDNSSISGGNITLEGQFNSARNWPVIVRRANLNAAGGNINITGISSANQGVFLYVGSNLTAANINVNGKTTGRGNQHGVLVQGATLNASEELNITGTSDSGPGIQIKDSSNLKSVQNINLNGSSTSGSGLVVDGTSNTLNATDANITGVSKTGRTGFSLQNLTLAGGVANGANVTLSSAGSAVAATNSIGAGIFDPTNITRLLAAGIENLTRVTATGLVLGNSTADDWIEDYQGSKGGGWIFDRAIVSQKGNISLKGVGFTNSTLTAGKDLTINDGEQYLFLNDSQVSAGGNITLTANGGINYSGSYSSSLLNMSAGGNISANASAGTVHIQHAGLTTTNGNIDMHGNSGSGVELYDVLLCATAGNINVFGQGNMLTSGYDQRGGVTLSGNLTFNSQNTSIHGVNNGIVTSLNTNTGVRLGKGASITADFYGGDVSIIGESDNGAGILWGASGSAPLTHRLNISASNFTMKGITRASSMPSGSPAGGIAFTNFYTPTTVQFNIEHGSSVSLAGDASAASSRVQGFLSIPPSGDSFDDNLQNKYTFTGDGNVSITGKSNDGDAVNIRGFDNTNLKGSMSITGESVSGTGVNFDSNLGVNLVNATVTGTSQTGVGIQMEAKKGDATLTNVTLNGWTDSGKSAVSLSGSNVSVNGTINGNVGQSVGTGVLLNGVSNFTISGAAVNGNAVDGNGLMVTGAVNASNGAILAGHVTGNGNGVEVKDSLTSPDVNATISGSATGGTGVKLEGTTTGVKVIGQADSGTGVELSNSAKVLNTRVNGTSTSGTGVAVTGSVTLDEATAANLTGHSTDGSGLSLQDGAAITAVQTGTTDTPVTSAVQLNGTSVNGSGVSTLGNVILTGTILNGSAGDSGIGVTLGGNLKVGDALSGVTATTGNGTALKLNNVNLNASSHGSPLILNPVVTGDRGTAIQVSGDTGLINVGLNGVSVNGSGVVIDGNLTTDQSVTGRTENGTALTVAGNLVSSGGKPVTGTASGSGTGVAVTGGVGDNHLVGTSATGTGAQLGSGASVGTTGTVNGTSGTGTGAAVSGSVNNQGTIAGVSTSGTGTDLQTGASLSGAGHVNGTSTSGTGVAVTGSVGDNHLAGTSATGAGVQLGSGASVGTTGTVNGTSGTGTGAAVSGSVNNQGTIAGVSTSGTGTDLQTGASLSGAGHVNGTTQSGDHGLSVGGSVNGNSLSGTSVSGTGVQVNNGAAMQNLVVNGHTQSGTGVSWGSAVSDQNLSVSGDAVSGRGVYLSNGATLNDMIVKGETLTGIGVFIAGSLTGGTIDGHAKDGGDAINLQGGMISGAIISGDSLSGSGVRVSGPVTVNGGVLNGRTSTGTGLNILGQLTKVNDAEVSGLVDGGGSGQPVNGSVIKLPSEAGVGMLNSQMFARIGQEQSTHNHLREGITQVDTVPVSEVNIDLCTSAYGDSDCRTMKVGTSGVQGVYVTPLVPVSETTDPTDDR